MHTWGPLVGTALALALVTSCVPPDDGFRAKLAEGCNTGEACHSLEQEAEQRVRACMSNAATSSSSSSDVYQDRQTAANLLESQERRDKEREATARRAAEADARARAQMISAPAPSATSAETAPSDCAGDRDERRAHMAAHDAWMVKRNELLDWVDAHCVVVDNGQDQAGQFMDSNGNITTHMYRTGYPEQQCKGKPPAPLPPWQDRYQGEPAIPYPEKLRNAECKDLN